MPVLSHLQAQHERYLTVNSGPPPPPPAWNPTFIPEPGESPPPRHWMKVVQASRPFRETIRDAVPQLARLLGGMVRR